MNFRRGWISITLFVFVAAGALSLLLAPNNLQSQSRVSIHHTDQDILQMPAAAQPVKVFGKKAAEKEALSADKLLIVVESGGEQFAGSFIAHAKASVPIRLARGPPLLS